MTPITLATLGERTSQEVFDYVVAHLIKQGSKSFREHTVGNGCAYRGEEGYSCAAGCLISDEEYMETMEQKSWKTLVGMKAAPDVHYELIVSLQDCHDLFLPCQWESQLKYVAEIHKLTYNPPSNGSN